MLTLGISGLRHQSTAALLRDRESVCEILGACEEAKLTGRRNPHGLPRLAMQFCLERAGAAPRDVEALALDLHPWRLLGSELGLRAAKFSRAPLASAFHGMESFHRARELMHHVRLLGQMYPRAQVHHLEHHRAHAAAAFFGSGFDRALVLTLDGGGGSESGLLALGEGATLRALASSRFPNAPGFLYSQVTTLLGWRAGEDEHRTQWLSTVGQPKYRDAFARLLAPFHRGELRMDTGCFQPGVSEPVCLTAEFLKELGAPEGEEWRADLATSLQAALEDAVVALAAAWRERTGAEALCFGGGVAFNALLVQALAERAGFARGFVSPVAGNAGCAIGAAWLLAAKRGVRPASVSPGVPFSAFLGPSFEPQHIKDLLDNCRLRYRNLPQPQLIQAVAELLAGGSFVGWFQGAAELGPRALGNRSILAAPRDEWVKENLNAFTKRREAYRPLAASVVEEVAGELFEFPWPSPVAYLGTVARVKDPQAIPGLAFAGDRARVHVVSRAANRHFHDLLTRVGQLTGRPLLINTSFNAPGEPLVVTPQEALRVFYSTGIDCLAVGNFLISK